MSYKFGRSLRVGRVNPDDDTIIEKYCDVLTFTPGSDKPFYDPLINKHLTPRMKSYHLKKPLVSMVEEVLNSHGPMTLKELRNLLKIGNSCEQKSEVDQEGLESMIKIEPEVFSCITIQSIPKVENAKENGEALKEVNSEGAKIDDGYLIESFPPNLYDQEHSKESSTNDEFDWNLMNSIRIVHEDMSLNEPLQGLTKDEWLEKLKKSCDFNSTRLSPKVLRLSWQEIVKLTAEQLPATRQNFPNQWHGDHLYTNRKQMRVWTIASSDRINLAELFFVVGLRGKELQEKDKTDALWPRCGDLRCSSPKHLLIVGQDENRSRNECFTSKEHCRHEPVCIRDDPLPSLEVTGQTKTENKAVAKFSRKRKR